MAHAEYPDKILAYNNSPSFNWKRHLDDKREFRLEEKGYTAARHQRGVGEASTGDMAGSTESEQLA